MNAGDLADNQQNTNRQKPGGFSTTGIFPKKHGKAAKTSKQGVLSSKNHGDPIDKNGI